MRLLNCINSMFLALLGSLLEGDVFLRGSAVNSLASRLLSASHFVRLRTEGRRVDVYATRRWDAYVFTRFPLTTPSICLGIRKWGHC